MNRPTCRLLSSCSGNSLMRRALAGASVASLSSSASHPALSCLKQQPHAAAAATTTMMTSFVRHNSSSSRHKLHDQTLSEIQGEETQTSEPEPQCPPGWTVKHELGTNYFTAKATFSDEQIDLYCPLRSPKATAAERDSGREDGAAAQPFSVFVSRTGKNTAMFVSMSVSSGELVVEQIRMIDNNGGLNFAQIRELHRGAGEKFQTAYEGPGIFELEEPFADPLFAFLEERGLTDEFGEFVALHAYHTEQKEYINWLQKLYTFTE